MVKKLKIILILFFMIFMLIAIQIRNMYQYSDGFVDPYRISVVDPKVNFDSIDPENFNITHYNTYSATLNNREIKTITNYIRGLAVKKYPKDKGDKLSSDPNIKYFLGFSNDFKTSFTDSPYVLSCYILNDNSIIIKVEKNSKFYYFKSKIDNNNLEYLKFIHKRGGVYK